MILSLARLSKQTTSAIKNLNFTRDLYFDNSYYFSVDYVIVCVNVRARVFL